MDYYSRKDGLNYEFQLRWNEWNAPDGTKSKQFPDRSDGLLEQYYLFEKYMNEKKHPNVNLGAAISGSGLLTDHGVEHVKSVINHALDIISDVNDLTGYEIYILLMAIHFHDLGNVFGRDDHEQRIADIIDEMGDRLPLDNPEKEYVAAIATAHGGYVDGDKDTISYINLDEVYSGIRIRPRLLAAILRFADEISDDLKRAGNGVDVPEGNKVFHEYSKALAPISVVSQTLRLHFRIPYNLTQDKIGKGDTKVFLYDEIKERLAKCMRELEYCRKYSDGLIKVTTLDVAIDYLKKDSNTRKLESDAFRLSLHGYPDKKIFSLEHYLDNSGTVGETRTLKYKDGEELCVEMKKWGD